MGKLDAEASRRVVHRWSIAELDILRSDYKHTAASVVQLSDRLGLRPQQVESQIYHQADKEGRAVRRCQKERLDEDGEKERYCPHCGEWWPATTEFFWGMGVTNKNGEPRLQSWCNACRQEDSRNRYPWKYRVLLAPEVRRFRKLAGSRRWKANHRGKCQNCGGPCKYNSRSCKPCYNDFLRGPNNPWKVRRLSFVSRNY